VLPVRAPLLVTRVRFRLGAVAFERSTPLGAVGGAPAA
jgi:hypothetical protein